MNNFNKDKKAILLKTSNVILFVVFLYMILLLFGKYFLYLGETEIAEKIFQYTFNSKGHAIAKAGSGFMEEAIEMAGDDDVILGKIHFSSQSFSDAVKHFKAADHTPGIFYSLSALGKHEEAKEILENIENKAIYLDLIDLKIKSNILDKLARQHEQENYISLASSFLKLNEYPTSLYYLKKQNSQISNSYFNIMSNNHAPFPLAGTSKIKNKFDILNAIVSGNIEQAYSASDEISYDIGLIYISMLTGNWKEYFVLLDKGLSDNISKNIPTIEEAYAPVSKNKIAIDAFIKENNQVWVQQSMTTQLLSLPQLNEYLVVKKVFVVTTIAILIVLIGALVSYILQLKRRKTAEELSVLDAVQQYPQFERPEDSMTPSHSWNVLDLNQVRENEFIIIKTAFDKLNIPYSADELESKLSSAKVKNKAYKVYSIASQFNVFVKMTKSTLEEIDTFSKDGIIILIFKDSSLQLFISKKKNMYLLFDGKARNKYDNVTLDKIRSDQVITLKKM